MKENDFKHGLEAVSQNEVKKFMDFVRSLDLNYDLVPGEFGYNNAVLVLVDAVLSINRQYKSFVVPRVEIMRCSGIQTLEELLGVIEEVGIDGFCGVWKYKHPERVEILRDLAIRCLEIKEVLNIEDDLEALNEWGKTSKTEDFDGFGIKGFGFTTFQYLRLLCGSDTTKPDVHLKRAIEFAVERKCNLKEVVEIVEQTGRKMGVGVRQLDYAIWNHYSL
jgi:mycofactocin precursor